MTDERTATRSAFLILGLILTHSLSYAWPMADEEVFAPMRAEMERSLKMRKDGFEPPYFLAYRLTDIRAMELSASFGALTDDDVQESRVLYVEARAGTRTLDNTDLGFQGWHMEAGKTSDSLRAQLWSLTDKAYKSALSGYLEKKAKRATELVVEELDDFSVEVSTIFFQPMPAPDVEAEKAGLAGLLSRVSAVFRDHPFVYESRATARRRWSRRYLLTSEGTRLAAEGMHVPGVLRVSAMTRASDGMRLDEMVSFTFRDRADIPPEEALLAAARRLAGQLDEARASPVQPPAAAPVILDPEVTSVLFHEALGHKLEGQRQRDPAHSQVFKDLVGKRILPEHLSFVDDPTLARFQGAPLSGHYLFDEEGVPAQRVVLVDHGVLRNFLMSRWPVKGFPKSNGHGRADPFRHPTGRMANIIVLAHRPVGIAALELRLREICRAKGKPYGFLLVGSFGGENPNLRRSAQTFEVNPRRVFRVDALSGAKTRVRGVKMAGTPLVLLDRIVAAGDDARLANEFVCGAESGHVPVGQIAPSVLISEAELQRIPEDRSVLPLLPSPFLGERGWKKEDGEKRDGR
ncbi:MAG: TldD/PmbA family protein [Elusimicrobia bacterium]|nr:TldD/PmbA family protein [Elusimicrobiota bacterium]